MSTFLGGDEIAAVRIVMGVVGVFWIAVLPRFIGTWRRV
jgi:hypothetical protein